MKRTLVAGLLLLTLAGCAAPPAAPPSAAAETQAASQPASQPAPESSAPAEPAESSAAAPAASVSSYGTSSKECAAASEVLKGATKVGLLASQGKVTQADFEAAYTGAAANDLPVDALPVFADLKTVSLKLVGLDQDGAAPLVGEFSAALANFTSATMTICS